MNAHIEPGAAVRFSARALLAATLLVLALLLPSLAEAQVRAGRLDNDTCLVSDFISFDDVVMTAVATHDSGSGDVYQAICDDEDCWGFSINRGSAINVLTTGLTPAEYEWFVCAWNGSVRKVVANLTGGPALYGRRSDGLQARKVHLDSEEVPEGLRRYAARLARLAPPGQ